MKHSITRILAVGALGLLVVATHLSAQTSAFTYQGALSQNGQPANGTYDFMFRLLDAETDGTAAPVIPMNPGVGVTNGLFSTGIDFGAENFNGANLWLEISVRTNGGGAFTTLAPRQLLTSAPYAVKALGVPQGTITSAMLADGAVTSAKIAPGAVSQLGTPDGASTNALLVSNDGFIGVGTNAPAAGLHIGTGGTILTARALYYVQDERDGYTNLWGASAVAYNGTTLAVSASNDDAVTLIQFSPPNSPSVTSQIKNGTAGFNALAGAASLAVSGNLLAVAGFNSHAVSLIDISNPYTPVLLSVIQDGVGEFDSLRYPISVAIQANLLVVASAEKAVTLIDISEPSTPVLFAVVRDNIGGFDSIGTPSSLAVFGSLLAIGSGDENAVTLVELSTPSSPVLKSTIKDDPEEWPGTVRDVRLSDGLLVVAGMGGRHLLIFDVSDPEHPFLRSRTDIESAWGRSSNGAMQRLALNGDFLATAGPDSTVLMIDISNPEMPSLKGVFPNGSGGIQGMHFPTDLLFAGSTLVVANGNGLNILDLLVSEVGLIASNSIGIGTTTPQARLHVVGNVFVENAEEIELRTRYLAAGYNTTASGEFSTAFGYFTEASGNSATALGNETFASGSVSTALGYQTRARGDYSFASGIQTVASGYASLATGASSTASGTGSTAMGSGTVASGSYSTAMGHNSIADGPAAFAVGWEAKAHGPNSTAIGWGAESTNMHSIAMGYYTQSHGESSVAFGFGTRASGTASTALGASTQATNSYSLAAGRRAMAWHAGSLVWGDSTDSDIASTNNNSVTFRASGGYRLFSNAATNAGVALAPNATAWSVISDRAVKKDFAAVDGREVLEKLAAVPVQSWHYQWESADATPHLGPVAQDFKAAFYPGRDDKSITTLEFDGVAMAAIQGLNQKLEDQLEQKQTEITELQRQNAELLKRLEAIEARLR